jgi:site-specific DNA-cytosine methylase
LCHKAVSNRPRTNAYGVKIPIPPKPDILIAGFSCVDFSRLNGRQKTLYDGGESADTLAGILGYVGLKRPSIIIFENVISAPWDEIQEQIEKHLRYYAIWVRLDTKEFYIPHTRVRGYMCCVDADMFGSEAEARQKLKHFLKVLDDLKRPASSPASEFMLDEDDERVRKARDEHTSQGLNRVVDWGICRSRHDEVRLANGLGPRHPTTKWAPGGSCKVRDYMWQRWTGGTVERVKDTLDIHQLRSIQRGFDPEFKL